MRSTTGRREYVRRYQRERAARLRAEWLAANGPCRECGSPDELEVDHIDPATKVSSAVWSWAPVRRAAELAKCQVLCADCHKRKSDAAMVVHGTRKRFVKGCACTPCDTIGREAERVARARKRRAQAERLAAGRARSAARWQRLA